VKLRLIIALLCAMPLVAFANGGSAGSGTLAGVTVDTWDQIVGLSGSVAWSNPDACGGTTTAGVVLITMSTTNYKDLLATALTAAAAGKSVFLWVVGCSYSPWSTGNSAPVVTAITVYP
jgi:hypothetical protein